MAFTVCLNGAGLAPGSYTGNVYIEGPKGLAPTSITVTENAKNSTLALFGAIGALLAAVAFLLLRGAAARQAKAEEAHMSAVADAARAHEADQQAELEENAPTTHVSGYLGGVLKDLNWWLTSIVALGLAAGTIVGIYSANPAWGSDTWASVAALVGPVFTAVGVQSVVTSLGRSVGR